MRVLVTGATGFIGTEVVDQLAASDHRVRALVRRPSRSPLVTRLGVEAVHGDLTSPVSIGRAVEGVDAIIHLGGRATFEPYDRLAPTVVEGTRTVAAAAVEHGVRSVVFGSSAFVYRSCAHIDGRTPVDPVLDYGRAKVDAERALHEIARAAGVRVATLRLPHVYGPQSLLFGMVRRRLVPFPGPGSTRFAQLHVRDAARALIAAAERGWDGTAPISDTSAPTWNEFFEVLQRWAPRVRIVRVPRELALAGSLIAGPLLGRLGATMVAPDTVRGWNLELPIEDRAIWSELDLEPTFPTIVDGIPATLDDVVAFRWRHSVADFS